LLSSYGAHFDVYDVKGNNPIHLAAMANAGQCCRFLATRGCNPKVKNLDGDTPKSIAKEKKAKDASKNIRKAEKQYAKLSKQTLESGGVNWSIRLYDYMYEHKERIKETFAEQDPEQTGKISKEAFVEVVSQEGFQSLVETEEMNKLIMSHEKVKDQIDYELFLLGKKYINKQFLINSFEGKKKKKKKKGKGKRGKTKVVIPICTLDEGPRMDECAPQAVFQPRHVHFTDTNRFNRDHPPEHPLKDDSAWYLKHPEREFVHISLAANRGDLHTLLDAFKSGIPVDIRDKYFKSPLMIAASKGDLDTCRFLLTCGADVNAHDNFKWTPLHHACNSGHLDVVKLLVDNGSNVNALTLNEATPFMRAVESASYPVVEYLLEKGAKITQENKCGQTAFDLAKDFADPRVYLAVKSKFELLPKPKDGSKKAKAKKKPEKKKKKDEQVE
jgi:ankyrin repeat protein